METQSNHWLPLTEYALRSGMSISTLRRKIKSNGIEYRMEDGRYLIRSDDLFDSTRGFASSDAPVSAPKVPTARPEATPPKEAAAPAVAKASPPLATSVISAAATPVVAVPSPSVATEELSLLREEIRRMQDDNLLRWKALEARVSGLAKKLEFFSEQMAEAKMLVKIFEEKLDHRA